MSNREQEATKDNSLFNRLLVPILIALVAGGTSPWWINLVKDKETSREEKESFSIDDSVSVQGSGNTVNDNSVNVQGSGNQVKIEKESDARAKGEFEIPAISGMTYHQARRKLINKGWIPFTQRHTYGNNPDMQYGNGQIFWGMGYWEIVSCSGTAEGFCRFEFSDPSGRRLVIITAGVEDRNNSIQAQVNRVFFDSTL